MDCKFHILISIFMSLLSLLIIHAEGNGSIFFFDSHSHRFLRSKETTSSLSPSDVGAAVSVLLGFAPPASLSAESSSKLNEVLSPNPFLRPRAVLMLEVEGIEENEQLLMDHHGNPHVGGVIRSQVLLDSSKAEIEVPDEDEISIISLDESLGSKCEAACMDKELEYLASWLGGSYTRSVTEPLTGVLTVTLASSSTLNLHMSKKADKNFAVGLVSLVHNVRRAMEMHEDISRNMGRLAELMTGSFTGIKALQEQYGHDGVAQQGKELFLSALTKLVDSVQEAYQGQLVGVIFFYEKTSLESGSMLSVKFSSDEPSSRRLEELKAGPVPIVIVETLLVRRTLAWVTGIILLISTLIGIYFLLNMPLTRDTLLYSNVKLD